MATICDISAFLYWRTPPVVRLLASAPEGEPLLANVVEPDRLRVFRSRLAEESPLMRALSDPGQSRARYGDDVPPPRCSP